MSWWCASTYEVYSGGFSTDPERTCYLTVRYDDFKAGERYRLEARAPVMQPQVLLYDANRKVVVNEPSNVFCIPKAGPQCGPSVIDHSSGK
jgi:hypothetical protein